MSGTSLWFSVIGGNNSVLDSGNDPGKISEAGTVEDVIVTNDPVALVSTVNESGKRVFKIVVATVDSGSRTLAD